LNGKKPFQNLPVYDRNQGNAEMDTAVDEAILEFIRKRKESFPDSNY
jgi:hypothetical protein